MTAKKKPDNRLFAALPLRSLSDERLTALHLRALGIIAVHDRRSGPLKKGAGCWASHGTLCQEIGCNYNNLSSAISDLGKFGYVQRQKKPGDKRQRVYIVVYEHDKSSSPIDELSAEIVRPKAEIVRLVGFQDIENENEIATKESLKENPKGIDFTKVTPIGIGDIKKRLAIFERKLKSKAATDEEVEACRTLCNQIINDQHSSDAEFYQAYRMLETYDELDMPEKSQPKEQRR